MRENIVIRVLGCILAVIAIGAYAIWYASCLTNPDDMVYQIRNRGIRQLSEEIVNSKKPEFEFVVDGFSKRVKANKTTNSKEDEKVVYIVSDTEKYVISDKGLSHYLDGECKSVYKDWEIREID